MIVTEVEMEASQSVGFSGTQLSDHIQSIIEELNTQKENKKTKQDSIIRYAKKYFHCVNNI